MKTEETLLEGVCDDQRETFRTFLATRSQDDLAKIHHENCPLCARAVGRILYEDPTLVTPPAPKRKSLHDRFFLPVVAATGIVIVAVFTAFMLVWPLDAKSDAAYYRDDRTGYCFDYHPGPGGFSDRVIVVVCDGVPAPQLQPMPVDLQKRLRYYRLERTGMCYVRISEDDDLMPVSCDRSAGLLR